MKRREEYEGIGSGILAETGFELRISCVCELHHAVPNHSWNDAAYGREPYEERLRFLRPFHQPPPRPALLPQYRHSFRSLFLSSLLFSSTLLFQPWIGPLFLFLFWVCQPLRSSLGLVLRH